MQRFFHWQKLLEWKIKKQKPVNYENEKWSHLKKK